MPTIDLVQTLTEKERTVYALLCENKSNEEIAEELCISKDGIVYHLKKIYAKLGVKSKGKTDLHLCRQRAITYGGTKIEQTIGYRKEDIIEASKRLTWYDNVRVQEIVKDLINVLENGNNGRKLSYHVSKNEFNGTGIDKHLLKTGY